MKKDFENKLSEKLKEINIEITEKQINDFYNYMNLLIEWNGKINLTAITEEDDVILKHFVDCLTIKKYINSGESVVDIGTGAGFPGVPLSIMCKENSFTLVDSLNKRINFLNEIKENIKLENIETVHARAEDFGQDKLHREKFDVAVSRAVANLSVLLEFLLPAVRLGGRVICMKGSNIEEELKEAQFAIKELGGKIKIKEEFYLPGSSIKRNIIIIEKIKSTPKKYPRKAGTPVKQPLNYSKKMSL